MNANITKGFTLVEVMVVVVIIGVLSSFAIPAYSDYVRRSRIAEATSALASKRVQMEQYFQDNRTYAAIGGTLPPACVSDTTTSTSYTFACSPDPTSDTYTLVATGRNAMSGFTFSVNQANVRSSTVEGVSGWSGNAACWVTNKGGTC